MELKGTQEKLSIRNKEIIVLEDRANKLSDKVETLDPEVKKLEALKKIYESELGFNVVQKFVKGFYSKVDKILSDVFYE